MEEPNQEVAALISHAVQERLKNLVEKLAVITEHRIDLIKVRFKEEYVIYVTYLCIFLFICIAMNRNIEILFI